MPASPPPNLDAAAIFLNAQSTWNERSVPPYESFALPCDQTLFADRCAPGARLQFIVRISDGRYLAQVLRSDGTAGAVLVRGGDLVGPAGAPFGFFRRTPLPGSALAAAPVPASDPREYPLRALLVDRASFEIVGLTYAQPFNASFATVHYRFAPIGPAHVWTLVHIDAQAGAERVDHELDDITFPPDEPARDFTP